MRCSTCSTNTASRPEEVDDGGSGLIPIQIHHFLCLLQLFLSQGDGIKDPGTRCILTPNPAGDSHPYPVEFRLPHWTVEQDWDLHNWLFRWGAGIRIEQPIALRQKQLQQAQGVVDLYGDKP